MPKDTTLPAAGPGERKRCFDPVVDERTRVLILGSLPGDVSLASQEYYGNKQNRFWKLMSEVVAIDLLALNYRGRLAALRGSGVGLWDVVAEASREGSLDSRIRQRSDNDLVALAASLPKLEAIGFNGGTAAKLGAKALGDHASRYRIVRLPSSSPAYTLAYTEKLAQWMTMRTFLQA